MTDFRSPDQIQSDLHRINPNFTSVARSNDLLQLLSDRPMAEASESMSGNGPVLFRLGVVDGPEWQGVRAFLDSRHVSSNARRDFQNLESDLRAADTNGDGYLNNQELVAFATAHTARWNTVAAFRSAAEAYLNRLPSYVAQPNLTADQVGKLYGIMNLYASQWQASGADPSRWGTVMGLSLQGFPSTDTANAPALIRRATLGQLTPQESAAVHRLLAISRNGSELDLNAAGSDAPLQAEEIGMLGQILEGANGHTFQGMTIVSGEAERAFFSPRNDASRAFQTSLNAARGGLNVAPPEGGWRAGDQIVINGGTPIAVPATGDAANRAVLLAPDQFSATGANTVRVVRAGADLSSVRHTVRVDQAAVGAAFTNARTTFAPFDTDHPEQISASTLLARAYAGDLNPAEAGALRVWMRSEAEAQGRTCNGTLDCLRVGAMRFFRNLARDPLHFLARNGGMVASAYLYRRFVLKNVVENRLNQLCGGSGADPNAYRNYEKFVQDQMRQSGLLKNVASRVASNPYMAMAVFNTAVAPLKDTGNLPVDMLTDLPLVPLMFHGMDTLSAFNSPMINRFAATGAGAGACRPSEAADPVPAPQAVTAAVAQTNARTMTQADFENAMTGLSAPALTPIQIASLPQDLQGLFTEDIIWGAGQWDQQQLPLSRLIPQDGSSSPIAEAIVQRYASNNPTLAARIRADVPQITATFRQSDGTHAGSISSSRTNAVRWALRQYIGNLQDGFQVPVSAYAPLLRDGGLVESYFGIRATQASIQSTSNIEHREGTTRLPETVDFAYATREHWAMEDRIAYNRAHPQPVSTSPSEAYEPYGLRNAEGQPIIFIPLPSPGAAVGLFELLFGGAAAAESAPAIGYGMMALSGA